jgi:murein L,D-transpeptidase YcbB/YkuD
MRVLYSLLFGNRKLGQVLAVIMSLGIFAASSPADAQSIAYKQSVAEVAVTNEAVRAFYKERNYKGIWTTDRDRARRNAFLDALKSSATHGLPTAAYDHNEWKKKFNTARTARDRGKLEVETTMLFLKYAAAIQSGFINPRSIAEDMAMKRPIRDQASLLNAVTKSNPKAFFKALPPKSPEYARLLKEKLKLEMVLGAGGWGSAIKAKKLEPGDGGTAVVALRNRLVRMGYMKKSASSTFDAKLQKAVQAYQVDNGLSADGVAGQGTIKAMNTPAQARLQQVIVGLERLRWLNKPLGKRHIIVNQAEFKARIFDNGKPTFETRVVVGKPRKDQRTPEFSDVMTHLIVNPTWHVPKSIAQKEYLPMLKKNPASIAGQGLVMTDFHGRRVDPADINASQYSIGNFPFDLKQPPGSRNALGTVKFMFPNKFNIYLHDTPSKSLFSRASRAFSHGCIRVARPHDLAYAILAKQSANPKAVFQSARDSNVETQIDLQQSIPVHLTYRTVWVTPKGRVNYRVDIYGRDTAIFKAMSKAGVQIRALRS